MASFNEMVNQAIDLLPKDGSPVVFDDYKAQLYAAMPESGQAVFARLIKADLISKALTVDSDGKHSLVVSRLPAKK